MINDGIIVLDKANHSLYFSYEILPTVLKHIHYGPPGSGVVRPRDVSSRHPLFVYPFSQ